MLQWGPGWLRLAEYLHTCQSSYEGSTIRPVSAHPFPSLMASNTYSPTSIAVDESIYSVITSMPECNELSSPPPASIDTPSSPPVLSIPPCYGDPFLDNLFNPDLPINPTSGYTQLKHLGDHLAPEARAILAQKVAQAMLKRAHKAQSKSDQRQVAFKTVTAKEALTHKMWREEVALLQQQLANV